MQRRALISLGLLLAVFVLLPSAAHATGLPFYGPIIPPGGSAAMNPQYCAGNWGGLIAVLNNIIAFAITVTITFVAPLAFAYAGFLLVTSAYNPALRAQAKGLMMNTVIGIVIALAGWLIVDLFLSTFTYQGLGGWTQAMFSTSGSVCLPDYSTLNNAGQPSSIGANGASTAVPMTGTGTGACDPSQVQAAASTGGYTLSDSQAKTFACLAQFESSCGTNIGTPGNGSSAAGAFQVLLQSNASCYENTPCRQAGGVTVLNCAAGFNGGNVIPGSAIAQTCLRAAANLNCSASAASCLLQKNNGSFAAWTADKNSSGQAACIRNNQ